MRHRLIPMALVTACAIGSTSCATIGDVERVGTAVDRLERRVLRLLSEDDAQEFAAAAKEFRQETSNVANERRASWAVAFNYLLAGLLGALGIGFGVTRGARYVKTRRSIT